jgi:hypothetical protein
VYLFPTALVLLETLSVCLQLESTTELCIVALPPAPIMAEFPPPPVNTIDWSNVGFKIREGMDFPMEDSGWKDPELCNC